MNELFNGDRLKEARYYNSLSITQLANKLSISKQMVSKYENGKSNPSTEVMFRIMKELRFPREFFYSDYKKNMETTGTFYRSLLTSTQKQKAPSDVMMRAATIYRDFLENYIEFPISEEYELDEQNPEIAANWLRDTWNLGNRPINNMINLLEKHGFTIVFLPERMEKVSAFGSNRIIDSKKYYSIAVDKQSSFFKQQFSVAHELGHWLMHADSWNPEDLENSEYRKMEKQANDFAAAFLLPRKAFISDMTDASNLNSIFNKKKTWFVSGAAMIQRIRQLGLIDDNVYLKLQKQISYRNFRKIEPLDEDYMLKSPSLLRRATELIVEHNLVVAKDIPDKIQDIYGVRYPNQLLEAIALLPYGYFDFTEKNNVESLLRINPDRL
ncbi:helix-turn-helix domain-containing protein [Latilactobacillus curvatus]